jgi:hypothetical protein
MAYDPVKNTRHKAEIEARQARAKREDQAKAVRSVARSKRGI